MRSGFIDDNDEEEEEDYGEKYNNYDCGKGKNERKKNVNYKK